ncbi:LysR family transcriptional regulator [Aidingimonas halophila]|uniref:Transcriptional regulator, LysR family n=1 Tax=Aidingimonas halophila TaxID=574349 RepID=A0A1H2STA0_9GAMM|nr:LysR family transcriptional regulator [Aidingimonas halophila]GHC17198.1 LysR family transcriptional regulator [Aidingimonas halophila]SDW34685.1 transcriptional regulator, LysR family [Aidingimonas halophila]
MSQKRQDPLDTYLLRVLTLLLDERSVSRTAIRMQQSQPAVSAALKKLRGIFGDELLVREKGGMVPTERALQLLPHARSALAAIDQLTQQPGEFDPSASRHTYRLGAPDYLAPIFMATASQRFRREAPNARLSIHALGPDYDFETALAEGDMDIVIGNWPEPPERMHLSMLLEDEIVCLVASHHPLASTGITYEDYLNAGHIVPLPYSRNQRGVIDRRLANLRIERREVVEAQSFNLAPHLLKDTDLIFTTSRHFARFYARQLGLTILPSPIDFPPMRFYQLWHDRTHHSPSHRWLRRLLSDAGRQIQ